MPRKTLKRLFPEPDKIKDHPSLQFLGTLLHEPNLWHLNRRSVSMAFAVGLFCAFLPIPFQMIVAAVLAVGLKSNMPISVGLVWITNPVTMPVIFYATYAFGAWMLNVPEQAGDMELSAEWIQQEFKNIWQPLLLGSVTAGIAFAISGYFTMRMLWRLHVVHAWRKRAAKRLKRTK